MAALFKLAIDFVPERPWRRLTGIVCALAIIGSALALWQRDVLMKHRNGLLLQVDAAERPTRRSVIEPSSTGPSNALPLGTLSPERIQQASREIRTSAMRLQRPWEPMLNALQAAVKDEVLIQRVQPDSEVLNLRISGQADSSQAFLDFVQRLQSDSSWASIEPISQSRVEVSAVHAATSNAEFVSKPLAFQISAKWRAP